MNGLLLKARLAILDDTNTLYYQRRERQAKFSRAIEGVGKDPGHSLEHVVSGYPWGELDDVPELSKRVEFVAYNFFEPQPAKGVGA